ncbi:hypothetical protein JCM10213_006576 [Rhodosporidiobolus nylandii]
MAIQTTLSFHNNGRPARSAAAMNGPSKPSASGSDDDDDEVSDDEDAPVASGAHTASTDVKREDEVSEGPAANWEVAYVYAFCQRFTELVDPTEPAFPHVMALEQALLDSSPPSQDPSNTKLDMPLSSLAGPPKNWAQKQKAQKKREAKKAAEAKEDEKAKKREDREDSLSSLSASDGEDAAVKKNGTVPFDDPFQAYTASGETMRASVEPLDVQPPILPEGTEVPPPSELIKTILLHFIDLLSSLTELTQYHGKKTWFHFLINFVTNRIGSNVWGGGFRWKSNLLRTRGLKPGQEKEANFWLLRWEDKIHLMRQMVDYILINAPSIKTEIKDTYDIGNQRIAKRDPSSNSLVILPLGRTSTHLTIYQLDTSPRLYASGSPYKPTAPWVALSSTPAGYRGFLQSLAEPGKADRKKVALRGPFAKAAAAGAKGKGKGKQEEEDGLEEERVLRARLEERLGKIGEWEEAQAVLAEQAARAAEKAAKKDEQMARTLARQNAGMNLPPRATRLRTRGTEAARVNYDEDDAGAEVDEGDEDFGAPRKRRRVTRADGEDETPAGSEAGDADSVASGSRRSSRRAVIPGERRSGRLAGPKSEEPEPVEEAEGMAEGEAENGAAPVAQEAPVAAEANGDAEAKVEMEVDVPLAGASTAAPAEPADEPAVEPVALQEMKAEDAATGEAGDAGEGEAEKTA